MKHFIYFIQAGKSGPIKIGITKNLMDRISVLQTANHEELILLCTIKGNLSTETGLLQQFRTDNIRGEWFKPSQPLLTHIASLPKDISDQFNEIRSGECKCGNQINHMKYHNDTFIGYCHTCLMIQDGRMAKLIETSKKSRPHKEISSCKVCDKKEQYLRKGRCAACSAYFKRTGLDRNELLIHRPKECINCGKKAKQLCQHLCSRCYYHQHRYGSPPSLDIL